MQLYLTPRTWAALFGLGVAIYAAISMLPLIINIVLLLVFTGLLALLIYPLAKRLELWGIQRGQTVVGVLALVVLVFGVLVLQILPLLTNSMGSLATSISELNPNLWAFLPVLLDTNSQSDDITQIFAFISSGLQQFVSSTGSLIGQVGVIFFALFVSVVLVYTLVSKPQVNRVLLHLLIPERYHQRVTELTIRVSDGLARWFIAQLSISLYYIIAYTIVNTTLGVPYGFSIAIIAGLLEFIPYLGGIVGLVLSVLSAASVGTSTVIWISVTNTIIGIIAVYMVSPYFYSRAINIPVGAILLGLFVGGQIGGILTALLTIPLVTVLVILVRELRPMPELDEPPQEPVRAEPLPVADPTPAQQK
ncbi:MAG: AI-2E family transporter [Chloroflexaceae bacterium]|nr:AI-2E family transporter [Chloroflexaceae bacterium]